MILFVGQGLAWRYDDGITGVNADRVQIFHVADGDGRVICVPDDLVFNLLIALDALFHQHLAGGRKRQRVFHFLPHLFVITGKTAPGSAQCKCGTQNHRIADGCRRRKALFDAGGNGRRNHRLTQLFAQLLELLPVLRPPDARGACPQQLDLTLGKNAFIIELKREIESRLSAESRHNRIRPLIPADPRQVFQRQRLHVDLVRNCVIRHDGRGVRVGQNDLISLFPQCQARLCSGVVEFRRLPDHNGAGSDDQYFFQICPLRHFPRCLTVFPGTPSSAP